MSDRANNPEKSPERASPRLSAALDQLAEGVIITDKSGEIVFLNAAAIRLHGLQALGVTPTNYALTYRLTMMDGTPYPSEELPLARAVRDGCTVTDAYWRIERQDGPSLVALGTANPVLDEDGQQIGAVLTLRDETEREAERAALQEAMEAKDLMLREMHHRVKNNLQLVSSLLRIQGRRTDDPNAQDILADLSSRIDIVADIHRALYETLETDTIEVVSYLARLSERHLAPLVESFNASFEIETAGSCILPIEKATSLSLAVNELVLTSLKRALPNTSLRSLNLSVSTSKTNMNLIFQDKGANWAETASGSTGNGLGELLVHGLERHLCARIKETIGAHGRTVSIRIPLKGNIVSPG